MKLSEFNDFVSENIDLLNSKLGIIKSYKYYYNMPIEPDYSGGYDGYIEKDYYFRGQWDFNCDFFKIFSVKVSDEFVAMPELKDNICSACPKTKSILHGTDNLRADAYINSYFKNNPGVKDLSAFDSVASMEKGTAPSITVIRVDGIDNNLKKIKYSGSFYSAGIDHGDVYEIICELTIKAAKTKEFFYFELLIEAYSLLDEGNYKMSYFMAYSALENYVNGKINGQDEEERFECKFKKAFETVQGLTGHETYSKLYDVLGKHTRMRNIIAHGREGGAIINGVNESSAMEIYIFVATVILTIENKFTKLIDMKKYIKPKVKR